MDQAVLSIIKTILSVERGSSVCPNAVHNERELDIGSALFHRRMYQDKLASLKRQLQQLQEGNRSGIILMF